MKEMFDVLFLGAYTRDTVVSGGNERVVDGGAFYYGASVAASMGLSVGAVTRLAAGDRAVVHELERRGVAVRARETPDYTCLRIEYSTADPDEREIRVTSTAGSFDGEDLGAWRANTAVVGASFRGEVSEEVLGLLVSRGCRLALDVQGYVRVVHDGRLRHEPWPNASRVLPLVSILKADVNEAELLAGTREPHEAALDFLRQGAAEVLLTSKDGVIAADPHELHAAPFLPRRLVGRSGRGDTCLAAYAASRITRSIGDSLVWAAAVTSCKLEHDGPFRGTIADVQRRAEEIRVSR